MGTLRINVRPRPVLKILQTLVIVLAFIALLSLCLEYGFETPPVPVGWLVAIQLLAVAAYVAAVVVSIATATSVFAALKRQWPDVMLIAVAALILGVQAQYVHQAIKIGTIYVATIQVLIVLRFFVGMARWNIELSRLPLHPARLLVGSFLVIILIGAGLLALPKATSPEIRAEEGFYKADRYINCLFTAVSATCVTGLVVYDTGRDFTRFGQIVILSLIQVGGLGIMIFGSLFGILAGRRLSLRQSLLLQDSMSRETIGRMSSMIRFVVIITFITEGIGAILLYPMFAETIESFGDRVFYCIFHAVSAFCNAGFALQGDSLIGYRNEWPVYFSIMPLIVIGGLGFPVLEDLVGWARSYLGKRQETHQGGAIVHPHTRPIRQGRRLRLHTKLVLTTTGLLIVVPTVMMFLFESWNWRSGAVAPDAPGAPAMVEMPAGPRICGALFQSVTARTAGFNTVPLGRESMSNASHYLLMLLMFIGGSPASTAGGIRTGAFAVLVLGLISTLRGRESIEAFGRTVPLEVVRRASVVTIIMGMVISGIILALCVAESALLLDISFEAVSACGTVGLSTGLTDHLTRAGRIVIMLGMFAGRLGPLTVLIAVGGQRHPPRYEYPPESVAIG